MNQSGIDFNQKKRMLILAMQVLSAILVLCIIIVSVAGIYSKVSGGISLNALSDDQLTSVVADKQTSLYGSLILVNNSHEYTFPSSNESLSRWYDYKDSNGGGKYGFSNSSLLLNTDALPYAHNMLNAMSNALSGNLEGDDKFVVSSAYRTKADQAALGSTVKAGFSDHHTGYTFTVKRLNSTLSPDDYEWLHENIQNYGFIFRYPEEKASLTGVNDYPNCLRYVGVAHAQLIKQNNLCLEEYIDYLKENAKTSPLFVKCNNGEQYYVYYYTFEGKQIDIKIPKDSEKYPYTVSGTNDGGVVVTIKVK